MAARVFKIRLFMLEKFKEEKAVSCVLSSQNINYF